MAEEALRAVDRVITAVLEKPADIIAEAFSEATKFLGLDENERKAIAYALIGDLSPLPEPLDAPLDEVVQRKLMEVMPEMDKGLRYFAYISEHIPVLEKLPNYLTATLITIALKRIQRSQKT